MRKLKLSFAFVLMLFIVGMYSAVAFAAGSTTPDPVNGGTVEGQTINTVGEGGLATDDKTNDNNYNTVDKSNANKTGSGVGTQDGSTRDQVLKSSDLLNKAGDKVQRTHGEYMNNTNSCASCHQTHTGASESLLFKDGRYQTCTACHDGTLGFYNVFTQDNSAGTFGGTHTGNMSVHLANGTMELKAAPGGNMDATTGVWTEEFSCASCHAPHGSYSDRLLNENPNEMADVSITEGGQKVIGAPVVDSSTVPDINVASKVAAGDITITYNGKDKDTLAAGEKPADKTENYIVYRFKIGDTGAPTNADYAKKGLLAGDIVLQVMHWNATSGKYEIDTKPFIHEYEFDTAHQKHYITAFYDGSVFQSTDSSITKTYNTDPAFTGKLVDIVHTDSLKAGEKLGQGFLGVRNDETTYPGAGALTTKVGTVTTGNIARGYVVKLDVADSTDPTLAKYNVKTTNVASLWNGTKKGGGVAMSSFCASCHTDYLAASKNPTGTFDHAYRHSTNSDSYTCIRCHYAHGTDVTVMRDSRGLTYNDILTGQNGGANYFTSTPYDATVGADNSAREALVQNYLTDKNPSSALKRYTNMAVCWGCHTSSHSGGTRNTDSYEYNPNAGVDTDRNGLGDY